MLPTHRIVRGLGDTGPAALLDALGELFEVSRRRPRTRAPVRGGWARRPAAAGDSGSGRATAGRSCRPGDAFEPSLPSGGEALRRLDVTLLGVALERLLGIDAAALAGGERIAYTKSAAEAARARSPPAMTVPTPRSSSSPTPVASIVAVAATGDVMPQKSTYFFPKALTGLVINPHEW